MIIFFFSKLFAALSDAFHTFSFCLPICCLFIDFSSNSSYISLSNEPGKEPRNAYGKCRPVGTILKNPGPSEPTDTRQTQTEVSLGSMEDGAKTPSSNRWTPGRTMSGKNVGFRAAEGRAAATWNTPWEMSPLTLYDNLPKHQTTALMLLRTEVIGLNA